MNRNNEKHFNRRLNIQVCELLQVLTEEAIKRCFEKKICVKKFIFSKVAGLQAYGWQCTQRLWETLYVSIYCCHTKKLNNTLIVAFLQKSFARYSFRIRKQECT